MSAYETWFLTMIFEDRPSDDPEENAYETTEEEFEELLNRSLDYQSEAY